MKAKVFERTLRITEAETLVAGSVNQYVIAFEFAEAWLDYACEAVFKREDGTIKEALIVGGLAVIPWEAVQEPGYLVIGVYGIKDDQIRPTVWSSPIQVHAGAAQGDPAIDYETTPWQDALTDDVAVLQDKTTLADISGAVSVDAASGVKVSSYSVYKCGNTIHLFVSFSKSSAINAGSASTTICTFSGLPLPNATIRAAAFNGNSLCMVALNTSGSLSVRVWDTNLAANTNLSCDLVYLHA